jgi:hypothetical protein
MRRFSPILLALAACHTPRVSLDDRGYLVVESRPEFYIGLAHVPPSEFQAVAEAGFNVVTTTAMLGPAEDPAALQSLADAGRHGLRVIAEIDTPLALRAKNETFRMHPALLAWMPFENPDDEELVKNSYREIIRADSEHPIFMPVRDPASIGAYWKYAKVIAIAIFPIPDLPLVSVPAMVRQAWGETTDRSIWAAIQLGEARHSNPPEPKPLRRPTLEEVRSMTYLAIIQSARGILFHGYEKGELPRRAPELWEGVRKLAAELGRARPAIMVRNAGSLEIGGDEIHAAYRRVGDEWFLIYANPTDRPAKSEIDLPAGPVRQISLELAPFQAGVFQLSPDGKLVPISR